MPSDKSTQRRRSRSVSRSDWKDRSTSRERSNERRKRRMKYRRHSSSSSDCSRRTGRSPETYQTRRRSGSRHKHSNSRHKRSTARRSRSTTCSSSSFNSDKSAESSYADKKSVEIKKYSLLNLDVDTNAKKDLIDQLNADCFVPKSFVSSSKKIPDKVIIDLNNETVSVATPAKFDEEDNNVCHNNFCGDSKKRMEKWIKKIKCQIQFFELPPMLTPDLVFLQLKDYLVIHLL